MSCPKYLYDELFPVKIYHPEHYAPHDLTANEKLYFELYNKAEGDVRKVDLVMSDSHSYYGLKGIKNHLEELGLIKIPQKLSPEDAKDFVIAKSHTGLICDWCGRHSYVLHEHHYPIMKSDGGTDTVHICPNCHCTFHIVCSMEEDGE